MQTITYGADYLHLNYLTVLLLQYSKRFLHLLEFRYYSSCFFKVSTHFIAWNIYNNVQLVCWQDHLDALIWSWCDLTDSLSNASLHQISEREILYSTGIQGRSVAMRVPQMVFMTLFNNTVSSCTFVLSGTHKDHNIQVWNKPEIRRWCLDWKV